MADIYFGLEVKDWVMCVAVVAGPILAVQAQKMIERINETKQRRLKVFKTLMATRAERVSRDHVQALNMIAIEFYGRAYFGVRKQNKLEKAVNDKWKEYNSHLNDKSYPTVDAWFRKGDDLFIDLLYAMSQLLGYDFDKVQLKSDAYKPEAHVSLENAQLAVLNGWAGILDGRKALKMEVTNLPAALSSEELKDSKA